MPESSYHDPKLWRFDFDPLAFSTGTASMDNEQVGQYVRLLCHAWLDNHDCTLSNDPEELASIARAVHGVSPKVLSKFKLNEDNRLYNERQLKEWEAARKRVKAAKDKADARWAKERGQKPGNAIAVEEHSHGNADPDAKPMPISITISTSTTSKRVSSSGNDSRPLSSES